MVEKVRTALQTLTAAQKAWAGIAGVCLALSGVAVAVSGQLKLPAAVSTLAGRVESLDARIVSLEEFKRFQGCWMLEQSEGRDPNPCRYLLSNPEEFRPPFNAMP